MGRQTTLEESLEGHDFPKIYRKDRLKEVYCWVVNGWLERESLKEEDPIENMREEFSREFIMGHDDPEGIGKVPKPKVMYRMSKSSDDLDEFLSLVREWNP